MAESNHNGYDGYTTCVVCECFMTCAKYRMISLCSCATAHSNNEYVLTILTVSIDNILFFSQIIVGRLMF